jgi:hypothetical protein
MQKRVDLLHKPRTAGDLSDGEDDVAERSPIGGLDKRRLPNTEHPQQIVVKFDAITFDSTFDSGNLGRVEKVREDYVTFELQTSLLIIFL